MIFDTDVFVWVQRGNRKAASLIEREADRYLSVQTLMELLQCAKNKEQQRTVKRFLADFGFTVLPLTENIVHWSMSRSTGFPAGCGPAMRSSLPRR